MCIKSFDSKTTSKICQNRFVQFDVIHLGQNTYIWKINNIQSFGYKTRKNINMNLNTNSTESVQYRLVS